MRTSSTVPMTSSMAGVAWHVTVQLHYGRRGHRRSSSVLSVERLEALDARSGRGVVSSADCRRCPRRRSHPRGRRDVASASSCLRWRSARARRDAGLGSAVERERPADAERDPGAEARHARATARKSSVPLIPTGTIGHTGPRREQRRTGLWLASTPVGLRVPSGKMTATSPASSSPCRRGRPRCRCRPP